MLKAFNSLIQFIESIEPIESVFSRTVTVSVEGKKTGSWPNLRSNNNLVPSNLLSQNCIQGGVLCDLGMRRTSCVYTRQS